VGEGVGAIDGGPDAVEEELDAADLRVVAGKGPHEDPFPFLRRRRVEREARGELDDRRDAARVEGTIVDDLEAGEIVGDEGEGVVDRYSAGDPGGRG
jgi:hypothetical protein